MVQVSTCKHEFTSNEAKAKKRLKQNTSNFARIFSAVVKNFLAFGKTFLLLQNSTEPDAQSPINDLSVCAFLWQK